MKAIKRTDFDELMKGANSFNDSARRQAGDKVWQIVADAQRAADWELQASRLAAVEAQQAMTIAEDQVRETVRLRLEIVRLEAERIPEGKAVPESVGYPQGDTSGVEA